MYEAGAKKEEILKNKFSAIFIIFCFSLVLLRLAYLQIVKGASYREEARQSASFIPVISNAPRGVIYDREGRVLASNKKYNSLIVLPSVLLAHRSKLNNICRTLSKILKESEYELREKLENLKSDDSRPFTLYKDLTFEQVVALSEHHQELFGITVQHQDARYYMYGDMFAHTIGYTGTVSKEELEGEYKNLSLNDIVGKYGLEKVFDHYLRGKSTPKVIRVDRQGQPIEEVDVKSLSEDESSKPGKSLTLTLDLDMQKVAYEALGEMKGAAIMIDAKTGEVLALVSKPAFDPNMFTTKLSGSQWSKLNSANLFLNRALSSYPPGSIWKPIVLLAALQAGAVKPGDMIPVSGGYYLGSHRFGDWTGQTGIFTLQKVLAWSRDTAFYRMADQAQPRHVTDTQITYWGKKAGAGKRTGLELEDESSGLIPDKEWQKKHLDGIWRPGYSLNYSIGQGYLLVTPAQAVRMAAFFGNKGKTPKLRLLKQVAQKEYYKSAEIDEAQVDNEFMKIVREGMTECVESGTCAITRVPWTTSAGKTGSAEAPPHKRTHGWYICFSPVEEPEIAIAVFGEGAGHGGSVSAPVAKKMLEAYYRKHHPALFEKLGTAPLPVQTISSESPNVPPSSSNFNNSNNSNNSDSIQEEGQTD